MQPSHQLEQVAPGQVDVQQVLSITHLVQAAACVAAATTRTAEGVRRLARLTAAVEQGRVQYDGDTEVFACLRCVF
jgi:hypothetical protein